MFTPVPFANSKLSPKITISTGNGQTASQGQNVATAPSVLVADGRGNPIAGVSVTFAVTLGGGSVTGASQTTNASGLATVTSWTLGTVAGAAQTLRATVNGYQGTAQTVDFSATVAAAASIAVFAGNGQTANVSSNVATAPSIRVLDSLGNACSGITVSWAVTAGGGSVNSTGGTTTNGSGIAAVTSWTMGASAGANTLQATSAGLTGSPVSFSATAVQPKTVAATDSGLDDTVTSSFTFSGKSIGAAVGDRYVIVTVASDVVASSVTVGGSGATLAVAASSVSSGTPKSSIWVVNFPSGTTADVVVNFGSNSGGCVIGVFRATGMSSTTPNSTNTAVDSNPISAGVTALQDGICVAAAAGRASTAASWSSVTEGYDLSGGFIGGSGAYASGTSAGALTPSCTLTSTGGRALAVAAW